MKIKSNLDLEELAAKCMNRTVDELFKLSKEPEVDLIGSCRDSVILITGAAGFIAQPTLTHILAAKPRRLFLADS